MRLPPKKLLERGYVDILRENASDFPIGELVGQESPDFVVRGPDGSVGIEVTRLYQSSAGRRPDECQRRIVDEARKIAKESGLPPLRVSVLFSQQADVRKPEDSALAKLLADVIGRKVLKWDDQFPLTCEHGLVLPIEAVTVKRVSERDSLWEPAGFGEIVQDFACQLQECIDKKEQHISRYLRSCNSCWLSIVADWYGPSAFFEISEETATYEYSCSFERVFFLDQFSQRVSRLRTSLPRKLLIPNA